MFAFLLPYWAFGMFVISVVSILPEKGRRDQARAEHADLVHELKLRHEPIPEKLREPPSFGLSGHGLRLGPSVGVAFPHLANATLEADFDDRWGAALKWGFIPRHDFSSFSMGVNAFELQARWYPLRGSFFMGAGLGRQTVHVTKQAQVQGYPVDATVDLLTITFVPQIGWRWKAESGLFFGVSIGWQYALSAQARLSTNAPALLKTTSEYKSLESDVQDQGRSFGKTGLPSVGLFTVGWLF